MATLSTFFDMVYVQVSGSPGTGNATLGSALIGFQTPAAAGITNGTPVSYRMTDGTNWETAHGTINVSGSTYTLVRGVDTIRSNNSNSLVNFTSASGVTVLICPLSQDLNYFLSAQASQMFNSTQQAQMIANLGLGLNVTNFSSLNATPSCVSAGTFYTCGFGYTFTPAYTGKILLFCQAFVAQGSGSGIQTNDIIRGGLRTGTGTPPSLGAVATSFTNVSGGAFIRFPYNSTTWNEEIASIAVTQNLTVGTTYWYDFAITDNTTAGVTVEGQINSLTIFEF
jgi:hypothetical protein